MDSSRIEAALARRPHPLPARGDVADAGPVVTEIDRKVARWLLAGAVIGGAWLLLRVPRLRQIAWRAARGAIVSGLPAIAAREARAAWEASARPRDAAPAPRPVAPPPTGAPPRT